MSNVQKTMFDNTYSQLQYQGDWFVDGTWTASDGTSGTLASSNDLSANVTFTFPMPATSFDYWGIRRCCGASYQICIDCDPNSNPSWASIDALNRTDDGKNPPVVLFSTQFDTPGIHTIILRNQADTRFTNGNSQITLASFELDVAEPSTTPPPPKQATTSQQTQPSQPTSTSPSSSPNTSSQQSTDSQASPTTNTPSSGSVSMPHSSNNPTSTGISSSPAVSGDNGSSGGSTGIPSMSTPGSEPSVTFQRSSSDPGAIAGGVLGGLGAVLVAALLLFWCRSRRASSRSLSGSNRPAENPQLVQPFLMRENDTGSPIVNTTSFTSALTGPTSSQLQSNTQSSNELQSQAGLSTSDSRPKNIRKLPTPPTVPSTTTSTASTTIGPFTGTEPYSISTPRSAMRPRREVDAGPVDINDDDDSRTLPPNYGDIFADR